MARRQGCTGLMVIRIWVDAGPGAGIRARITRSVDVTAGDTSVAYARSLEDVATAVHSGLDAFVAAAGATPPHEADGDPSP
jgi:hypothetical protein